MRSAGCIVNDMADRKFDREVERTKTRPLASGELNMWQASRMLLILLLLAFCIALFLGKEVIIWATYSLILVLAYPFMKRITWWPQFFLGLTFNWGALLGWVAVRGTVELPAIALYVGGIFWTLGYDTIYAHQDKQDDARIGVKSSALRLGESTKSALLLFYPLAIICWGIAGVITEANIGFFAFLALGLAHLEWQAITVKLDDPKSCKRMFFSNRTLGLIIFLACLAINL